MSQSLINRIPRALKKQAKILWHSGKRYECPLCGYRSRDLAPIGHDYPVLKRHEVIGAALRRGGCYRCGAYDRDKLVFVFLRDELKVFTASLKNLRILHIAPSEEIAVRLHRHGFADYRAGDLFAEGYTYPDFVEEMNVLKLPFEDAYFDLVICNHVLEHIENDSQAMREIHRVLKNGGKAILQVPISKKLEKSLEDPSKKTPGERIAAFGQRDHVRIYGMDYYQRLEEAGFEVQRINMSDRYPQYGLHPEEEINLAIKKPSYPPGRHSR